MTKLFLVFGISIILSGTSGCKGKIPDHTSQAQIESKEMTITVETMKQVLDAFNRHDLDAMMR